MKHRWKIWIADERPAIGDGVRLVIGQAILTTFEIDHKISRNVRVSSSPSCERRHEYSILARNATEHNWIEKCWHCAPWITAVINVRFRTFIYRSWSPVRVPLVTNNTPAADSALVTSRCRATVTEAFETRRKAKLFAHHADRLLSCLCRPGSELANLICNYRKTSTRLTGSRCFNGSV